MTPGSTTFPDETNRILLEQIAWMDKHLEAARDEPKPDPEKAEEE